MNKDVIISQGVYRYETENILFMYVRDTNEHLLKYKTDTVTKDDVAMLVESFAEILDNEK